MITRWIKDQAWLSTFVKFFFLPYVYYIYSLWLIFYQAWERIAMKKTENILQGGTPKKILRQKDPFGAF